jgi:hypothetical protein
MRIPVSDPRPSVLIVDDEPIIREAVDGAPPKAPPTPVVVTCRMGQTRAPKYPLAAGQVSQQGIVHQNPISRRDGRRLDLTKTATLYDHCPSRAPMS